MHVRSSSCCCNNILPITLVATTIFAAVSLISINAHFPYVNVIMHTALTGFGVSFITMIFSCCKEADRDIPPDVQDAPLPPPQIVPIKIVSWDVQKFVQNNNLVVPPDFADDADVILLQGTYSIKPESIKLNFPNFDVLKTTADVHCYCLSRKDKFQILDRNIVNLHAQYLWLEERATQKTILAVNLYLKNLSIERDAWIPETLQKIHPATKATNYAVIGVGGIAESLNTFKTVYSPYFKGTYGANAIVLHQSETTPFHPVDHLLPL